MSTIPEPILWSYLSAGVSNTDIATRVSLLSQFAGEEFVEFGTEDTVGDELSLFGDLAGHDDEEGLLVAVRVDVQTVIAKVS